MERGNKQAGGRYLIMNIIYKNINDVLITDQNNKDLAQCYIYIPLSLNFDIVTLYINKTPIEASEVVSDKAGYRVYKVSPRRYLDIKNGLYTGSPIIENLFYTDRQSALKRFNLSGNKPIICITGGSLGSVALNIAVKNSLNILGKNYDIIHLCGKGKQENIKSDFYRQYEFITDIEKAFLIADIVVTRGGSNALFELLVLKKPTLVIPLPKQNSRGDQIANANYFASKNLVKQLPQENLTPSSFVYNINDLYKHKSDYVFALQNYDIKIANTTIVNTILKYI